MIRAVLDTNTIVSGLGWGGPPGAVLNADRFEIVTSPPLLDELRRVLAYPKLQSVIGDVGELINFPALAPLGDHGYRASTVRYQCDTVWAWP